MQMQDPVTCLKKFICNLRAFALIDLATALAWKQCCCNTIVRVVLYQTGVNMYIQNSLLECLCECKHLSWFYVIVLWFEFSSNHRWVRMFARQIHAKFMTCNHPGSIHKHEFAKLFQFEGNHNIDYCSFLFSLLWFVNKYVTFNTEPCHNLTFTAVSMWTMIWYNCFYRCSGGPWFDVIGSDWCSETELKFFLSTFAKWHELVVGLFRTEKIRGEICRGTRTIETALGYWLTDWLTATLDLQKKEQ